MRIMVLSVDGIGPEITAATMAVMKAVDRRFELGLEYRNEDAGFTSLERHGTTLRKETLQQARECDGIILGPQSHLDYPPVAEGGRNVSAAFRVGLDLYANIRPARSRPFLGSAHKPLDLVIMREATEGFYPDRNMYMGDGEMMPSPDMALSVRKITVHASERIAQQAFILAMQRRRKVTVVHKVNAFRMTDGLFLECVDRVAKEFPHVEVDKILVDAMAAMLVRDPARYDVVLTTNFYGDILSDLASELSGSIGLAGAINANAQTGLVCAQAQHGSAPDIAGKNMANPSSLILSAAMMLRWLGGQRANQALTDAGVAMETAVDEVLADSANRPRDLGGATSTDQFGALVANAVSTKRSEPVPS